MDKTARELSPTTRLSGLLNEARSHCDPVQLILARMESHPDEFSFNSEQWGSFLRMTQQRAVGREEHVLYPFTDEEAERLWAGAIKAARQSLMNWALKTILKADEKYEEDK